jgi:hypothetical protein
MARITRGYLANFERALAPLRAGIGFHVCRRFNLNSQWLATGHGPMQPCLWVEIPCPELLQRELFSAVYDVRVAHLVEERERELRSGTPEAFPHQSRVNAKVWLHNLMDGYLDGVPSGSVNEFCGRIEEAAYDIIDDLEAGRQRELNVLDSPRNTVQTSTVTFKPPENFPELLGRLKRATAIRGRKAELARFLGVPAQRLYEWLAGRHVPGADVTLRILNWVRDQEIEQNRGPGCVLAPPEPKTQLERNQHAKPKKSGPP